MNTLHIRLLTGILLLVSGASLGSAQEGSVAACINIAGGSDTKKFLLFDRELRAAASNGDPALLVLLAGYPLPINDDTGTASVANAETLYARFESLFPKSVRAAVLTTKPEDLICNSGGIGYGRGDLWVEVRDHASIESYVIAAINLGSKSVRRQTGIRFVCRSKDQRILIDTTASGALRYRSWKRPRSITDRADLELFSGAETFEGTGPCGHRVWSFKNGDSVNSVEELRCSGDPTPPDGAIGILSIKAEDSNDGVKWCY